MRSHSGIIAAAGGPVFLRDLFTDANGTALQSHTMDIGPGWTVLQGAGAIQSNKLQSGTSGTPLRAFAESNISNDPIAIDVTLPASGNLSAGLFVRGTDQNTGWIVAFINDGDGPFLVITELTGLI